MTQYVINVGALPNDGTGDPLREAFNLVNLNFDQVFQAGPTGSNIQISNNTIASTNVNGNIILAPNGIGNTILSSSLVPDYANIRNLGSSEFRFDTLYAQYIDITGPINFGNISIGNLLVRNDLRVMGNIYGNLYGTTNGTHNGLVYDIDIRYMVWDFGFFDQNTWDNPIQFLLNKTGNIDMGTIDNPSVMNIDAGFY